MYRLQVGSKVYIGSTIQTLQKRLNHHRDNSRAKSGSLFDAIRQVGAQNITIELIEEIEYENKADLLIREKWWISQVSADDCLNCNKPIRTLEEKRLASREAGKRWREKNKPSGPRVLKKDDSEYHKKRWKAWADNNRGYLREQYAIQDARRCLSAPPTVTPVP